MSSLPINNLILIAEDDSYFTDIYQTKLLKEGFSIEIVNNGDDAVKLAREKKPALLLLDIVMPGKNGYETLEELRADPNTADIPVLVLSNLCQEENIEKAKKYKILDYLIKSNISINDIIEKIKHYMQQ